MNPYNLSIQLSANSYKNVVQLKGQRITYILQRLCMAFFGCCEVKTRFCRYMQGKESILFGMFFQLDQ